MVNCPSCNAELNIEYGWNNIDKEIICEECEKEFEMFYDETYNEESGEEYGWFYLDEI